MSVCRKSKISDDRAEARKDGLAPDLHEGIIVRDLPAGSATAAARVSSPTTAAAAGTTLGACFVHLEVTALKVPGIQFLDCPQPFFTVRHLDESESTGSTRKLVNDDLGGIDRSVAFKQALKISFTRIEGQVADVDIDAHSFHSSKKAPHCAKVR
jgi:hypothetical protein